MEITPQGYQFRLTSHLGQQQLQLKVLGEFNIQNVLAAMGAMLQLGYSFEALIRAVQQLSSVPGRIEQFYQAHRKVMAVVDYAHTPDALEQTLIAVRNHCQGQLWVVFGCGGDRDRSKRPLMGAAAVAKADFVVLTSDNPRSEKPETILQEIIAGIDTSRQNNIHVEVDRSVAIEFAVRKANSQDVVLLAGKGHESTQTIGTQVIAHSDAQCALTALSKRGAHA